MIPMEKDLILVAFDGSNESEKALEHAIDVANQNDEILILMVHPEPDADPFFSSSADDQFIKVESELESLKNKFHSENVHLTIIVKQGNIIEEILKHAEDPRCKLLVLGYKGVTPIGRFKLGSISGEVAKHAKVPVLVVR